jgi:lysozyme
VTTADLAALREQLIRHEGLRLRPYRCSAGKWTIGVGRNLEDHGITAPEAMALLDHDIEECLADLRQWGWFLLLDPVRQRALIDMRFNLGPSRLRGFKKFLNAMGQGDWARAYDEMLHSAWATQVGGRAMRLARMVRDGVES